MNARNNATLKSLIVVVLALGLGLLAACGGKKDEAQKPAEKKVLYWVDPMNPQNRSDKPGKAPDGMDLVPVYDESKPAKAAEKKILYWVDPMHPAYKSDKPGIAPDCGMDLVPVYEESGSTSASSAQGYATITVPASRQQLIGVQLGKAERRDLHTMLRTVGRVAADETKLAHIHTKFDGYIDHLYVDFTGMEIRKGQPLLSIYSPDLVATQQEFLLASRARTKLSSGSEAVSRSGDALYESARTRLLLWDITPAEIRRLESEGTVRKSLTVYSPVSGIVMAKTAVEGLRVAPGDSLFDIADLSRIWVLADVYESEIAFVKLGQEATVALSYMPGREWTGKVTFIAPTVDPVTRTVKVRVELPNPTGDLKPEMFADVMFHHMTTNVVAVPESAVLQTGTRSIVFVAKGEGRFEPREVTTGTKSDSWYEIRSGVTEGEEVVMQANFLIDSESRLKAALAEMSSAPAAAPAAPESKEHAH
jgi:Cu(I)/Ag(I) efflux system membrane fusion protein